VAINLFSMPESAINGTANEAIAAHIFVDFAGSTDFDAKKVSVADSGDKPFGISADVAASGEPVAVVTLGEGYVLANGNTDIAYMDPLKPGAGNDGVAIKASGSGDKCCAYALEAHVDNEDRLIRCLLVSPFLLP
jgi:hypothetical protein